MRTIAVIYTGGLPEIHIQTAPGQTIQATRNGPSIDLCEPLAAELIARGDFIPAEQTRIDPKPPTRVYRQGD